MTVLADVIEGFALDLPSYTLLGSLCVAAAPAPAAAAAAVAALPPIHPLPVDISPLLLAFHSRGPQFAGVSHQLRVFL